MEAYELNLFGFAKGVTENEESVYGILVHAYRGGKLCLFISPVHLREDKDIPTLIPIAKAHLRIGEDKNENTVYDGDILRYVRPNGGHFLLVAYYGEWKWKETQLRGKGGWYNENLCLWLDECELDR